MPENRAEEFPDRSETLAGDPAAVGVAIDAIECSETGSPDCDAPEVESSEIEASEIASSNLDAPEVESFEFESSDVEADDVQAGEDESSDLEPSLADGKTAECVADRAERLDRYLAARWSNLSRARFQKLIERGQVRVNGVPCTAKQATVRPGDRLRVSIPPAEPLRLEPQAIPLDVLFEDDQVIVVNKPAGLVVHPAPGHPDGTLVNALLAHCKTLPGADAALAVGGVQRPGVVHRLDRDTTGAIAFAKTDRATHHLQNQLRRKIARREYWGIVCGAPAADSGTVDAPLGRHPVDRKKQAIVPEERGGRRAVTHWFVEERLGNFTRMRFQLETGRTHQIRVHSAHLGHPLVGDRVYGAGRSVGVNLPGQALHAWRLKFLHPTLESWVEVEAPLPERCETLLAVLRRRAGVAAPEG